jgi:formate hydrogenlyase subunit 6/NADH:ubiquinone oxidoreductase subunit I
MYCGLCVEVCPTKSLTHTEGYEGRTSTGRGEFVLHFVTEPPEIPEPEKKEEEEKEAPPAKDVLVKGGGEKEKKVVEGEKVEVPAGSGKDGGDNPANDSADKEGGEE